MKTALVIIATGKSYHEYAKNLIASAKMYFIPHDVILFTDSFEYFNVKKQVYRWDLGFPGATITRFEAILSRQDWLNQYDFMFYLDADSLFVDYVTEPDVESKFFTATRHPGFMVQNTRGTPERNPMSKAYIPYGTDNLYFCGGFYGAPVKHFLEMAEILDRNIRIDHEMGITACHNDESHSCRYFFDNPPDKVLTPSYCFPEEALGSGYCGWTEKQFPPKILALNKRKK